MVLGVPPKINPTLNFCTVPPATAAETQTTAATPNTAATPEIPETPSETINRAAMINVDNVSPEIGLLEDPIMPTKLPDTVAKKNPTMIMTTAAKISGHINPQRRM